MAPSWGFQGKCLNNWVKCGSDIRVSLGIPSLCVLRNDVIWDMSLHIFNNREHSNTNTKPLCISKGFLQRWTILTGNITIKTNSPPPFTLLYVTLQIVPWDGPWDLGQTADECSAPSRLWWCWGGRGALLSHLGRQDLQHPHTPREGGLLETVMVR